MEAPSEESQVDSQAELAQTVTRELRPAAMLWISYAVGMGVWSNLAWRVLGLEEPLFWNLWGVIGAVLVGAFVFRDAEARRVFARPRRSAVEMVLLVGAVAWMIDYQWVTWLYTQHDHAMYQQSIGAEELPVILFWMAVLPALFEEWMFRGLMLSRLRRVLPLNWAIAAQAMLFGLLHFDSYMLLPHFFFGCVAGVLRVVAGGLWPCMLWHFAWNAACVLWPQGLL